MKKEKKEVECRVWGVGCKVQTKNGSDLEIERDRGGWKESVRIQDLSAPVIAALKFIVGLQNIINFFFFFF